MEPGEGRADRKTQITERGTECEEVREDAERQAGFLLQIAEGMLNSLLRTVEATADKVGAREQVFGEGETCLLKRVLTRLQIPKLVPPEMQGSFSSRL